MNTTTLKAKDLQRSIVAKDTCKSAICWLWAMFGVGTNQFKTAVNRLYNIEKEKMKDPRVVGYITAVILWEYKTSAEKQAKSLNQVFRSLSHRSK